MKAPIALIVTLVVSACADAPPDGKPVSLTIPRGASLAAVAESLRTHGIIDSPRWFRLYTVLSGRDRLIQAGIYDLPPGRPVRDIVRRLMSGAPASEWLVIPEGLMLSEIVEAVERQLGIPADSVRAAARDQTLMTQLGVAGGTLEGYLYPSTYSVRVGARAGEVIRQMVAEFDAQWRPEWDTRLDTLGMSRWDIVILASIIEGEVRHDADRRFVSSVYHNRLDAGWRLQADPTVIYALGRRRRLFERDYRVPSPYNTYLHDGLPPGPIGQPTAASLEAALYPATTGFFFFVAGPDGHHIFSRTLREHRDTINRIRG